MKNIFRFHILFYIFALICFLTGYFYNFLVFTLIIITHELGHIIGGLICKWPIEKIIIFPLGGLTIFKTKINIPLYQELFVTIMGPLFQITFFLIDNQYIKDLNLLILLFNLLPILPLDGSKIINTILNKFFSYYNSIIISVFISMVFITAILIYNKYNLISFLIVIFLIKESLNNYLNKNKFLNKLLLEKKLYNLYFNKRKIIKNRYQFFKNKTHIININNKYITEKEFLRKTFDIPRETW